MTFNTTFLPSITEIKKSYPLTDEAKNFITTSRDRAKRILQDKEKKTVLIYGPCSVHDEAAIFDYAIKFQKLEKQIQNTFFPVLRFFIEKPRTHLGWKGFIYDPHLDGSYDIVEGITKARQMLLKLADMKVACAMEFLDPHLAHYFDDVITWGFIGSRTCSSQIHRQMASNLSFPIGFKNSSDGNILSAILGAHSATTTHTYPQIHPNGRLCYRTSFGNPLAHIVLRGSLHQTNFDPISLQKSFDLLRNYPILPKILVDCSHGNAAKDYTQQKEAFFSVLQQIASRKKFIVGVMLESFLKSGKQNVSASLEYGISITDECLGWEETESLILEGQHLLMEKNSSSLSN